MTIASWNLEWLVSPETARDSRQACRASRPAPLPCDVALRHSRNSADLAMLAAYARQVDADVFAFQEVENEAIARQVFSGYAICLAPGPGLQHVGFAVRATLPHRCGGAYEPLTLGAGTQRPGLLLTIAPGAASIEIMAIHLKSGCAHDAPDAGHEACAILLRQAAVLHQWLARRASPSARYLLLGDFNRGRIDQPADPFWRVLRGDADTAVRFVDGAGSLPFHNCYFGAPFNDAIDHILLSPALAVAEVANGYRQFTYRNRDVIHYRLSDHCPVRISLNPAYAVPAQGN